MCYQKLEREWVLKDNFKVFKQSMIALSLAGSLFISNAHAVIVTDIGNTIQNTLNNLQDLEHRIAEEIERQANRLLEKELSRLTMQNDADQAVQELAATQKLEKNLRNQEIARQQAPLNDVCVDGAIFQIAFDGDVDCYRDEKTQEALEVLEERKNLYGMSDNEVNVAVAADAEETINACHNFIHSEGDGATDVDATMSHCYDSKNLVDSTVTTLQTGVIEKGAEMAVKILTEPVIRKKSFGSSVETTPEGRKLRLNDQRKDMLLELAQSVMLHNVEIRRSSKWADAAKTKPLPSALEALDSFNNNRLLSSGGEYLLKLGAAHKEKFNEDPEVAMDSTFTIEQVQRETAVMTAFLSHMAVLQYKSQLRIEQLQASLLSLEVNPLE